MWQIIAYIGMQVLSYLLTPKTTTSTTSASDMEATSVDSASPVPVLFGTRLMTQTNCVWYGDIKTTAIKSDSGGKK